MAGPSNPTITLPSHESIPPLGQGTWGMAEDPRRRDEEIGTLRAGIDLGLTVIDTAEAYADGGAEQLVGAAVAGRREDVFLVSKVTPEHATRIGTTDACERSLRRLGTDRIDLYLLHRPGPVPLEETVEAFTDLITQGKIRHWGVGNFDVPDLTELTTIPGGTAVETDQVLYNPTRRGVEWDLLPRCRAAHLPVMAYAPFQHGDLLAHPVLNRLAERHGVTVAQLVLAWVLRQPGLCAVAKASTAQRVREHHAALELRLGDDDLAELDLAFPPPTGPRPLEQL